VVGTGGTVVVTASDVVVEGRAGRVVVVRTSAGAVVVGARGLVVVVRRAVVVEVVGRAVVVVVVVVLVVVVAVTDGAKLMYTVSAADPAWVDTATVVPVAAIFSV
jgi:hypothetical protein